MLGDRLKSLRNRHNLTQQEVADKLGITRGTYAHYEVNKRQPDYETLRKIADYFKVSTDYLIRGKETDEKHNLFFFDVDGLSEEEIEDIKKHIEYVKWKKKKGD